MALRSSISTEPGPGKTLAGISAVLSAARMLALLAASSGLSCAIARLLARHRGFGFMWRADSSVRHQRADSILTICLIRTSLASLQPSGGIAILTGWPRAVSLAAAFFASSIPGCVPSGLGLSLSATIITGAPSGSGTLPRFEVPNATHTGWCVDCQRENPSSAPSQIRMSPLPGRHSAAPVKIPLIRRYFLPSSLSRGLPRNWTRANLPALPSSALPQCYGPHVSRHQQREPAATVSSRHVLLLPVPRATEAGSWAGGLC
jgi:hypothetical protein